MGQSGTMNKRNEKNQNAPISMQKVFNTYRIIIKIHHGQQNKMKRKTTSKSVNTCGNPNKVKIEDDF